MLSASDFIQILKRLRSSVSSGANPMSESEMDQHTIRGLREEAAADGRAPKPLVYVKPDDHLGTVVEKLFHSRCSMAPVLSCDPGARARS
jgi:5'-AMP-activated protein kinase, regulatory gamma subunit